MTGPAYWLLWGPDRVAFDARVARGEATVEDSQALLEAVRRLEDRVEATLKRLRVSSQALEAASEDAKLARKDCDDVLAALANKCRREHWSAQVVERGMGEALRSSTGFVECVTEDDSGGRWLVTFQRDPSQSPGERIKELEAEVAALRGAR